MIAALDAIAKAAIRDAITLWRGYAAAVASPDYPATNRAELLTHARKLRAELEAPDEDDADFYPLYLEYVAALDSFIACAAPSEVLS